LFCFVAKPSAFNLFHGTAAWAQESYRVGEQGIDAIDAQDLAEDADDIGTASGSWKAWRYTQVRFQAAAYIEEHNWLQYCSRQGETTEYSHLALGCL
jgi:hypothetical protein